MTKLNDQVKDKIKTLGSEPIHGSFSRIAKEIGVSSQTVRKWHTQIYPRLENNGNGTEETVMAEKTKGVKGEPLHITPKREEPEPELSCLECGGDVLLSHGKKRAICVDEQCGAAFDVQSDD